MTYRAYVAPIEIRVCGRSSAVTISASAATTEVMLNGVAVRPTSPSLYELIGSSGKVDVECPEGCAVSVSTASGSITTRGRLGSVRVMTVSGTVRLELASDVEARSASGRMKIGDCDGCCRVVTGSGRIELDSSADVEISTVSGRVDVGQLRTRGAIRTVTGAVSVDADIDAQLEVHTVSGKVAVELPASATGTMALRSVTGRVSGELAAGDGAHIEVSSISGAIEIRTG